MAALRDTIIGEIRRLAEENKKVPGQSAFQQATGLRDHDWRGVYWTKWSDALAEAGFEANVFSQRFDTFHVLSKIVEASRHFGHVPNRYEMVMYRREHPTFPSKGAVAGHFPTKAALMEALRDYAAQNHGLDDVLAMLPAQATSPPVGPPGKSAKEGFVYLLKSGSHFKIGRSEELERRVKEVRTAMPEALTLIHAIKTDDPGGIEAYWHRRFTDKRANGEWFKLEAADVAAFRRRKYQ